jgi:hypothetical protein
VVDLDDTLAMPGKGLRALQYAALPQHPDRSDSMPRKNKDTAPAKPARNYVYKVKAIVEGRELINEQISLGHKYKNARIEIERKRRDEFQALLAEFDPKIPEIDEAIKAADKALEEMTDSINKRGQDARKRSLATAEEKGKERGLKSEIKKLRADRKKRQAKVLARPKARVKNQAITDRAKAADKVAYNESPAFWGTKLMVEHSQEKMKSGAPPKWRRWNYEGAIAVQVQKGLEWAGALLCDDTRVKVQIPSPLERKTHSKRGTFLPPPDPNSKRSQAHKLGLVWLRVGTGDGKGEPPIWAKVLIHVHRQPPPDSRIKWVYLHRYLVGRQVLWKLRFALTREGGWPREHGDEGAVGVDIGYRMLAEKTPTPDADGQVMSWQPASPTSEAIFVLRKKPDVEPDGYLPDFVLPAGMRIGFGVGSDGESYCLVIPGDHLDEWHQAERLRANRDTNFNAIRDGLLAWFREDPSRRDTMVAALRASEPARTQLADKLPYLHQWESPDRLQELAWWWKDHRIPADRAMVPGMDAWRADHEELRDRPFRDEVVVGAMSVYKEVEAWRLQDRHLHDYEDHQRGKIIRWRDEQYRRLAAILSKTYRYLAIKDIDWAKVKKKAEAGEKDNPMARLNAQIAAPGTLQKFLIEAFGSDNTTRVQAVEATKYCHSCRSKEKFDASKEAHHACGSCGAVWELAANSAANLLNAVGSEVAAG